MIWDWNDLRYFLAVARAGTTLGAARVLGANQTTCARRIAALETGLGAKLFERTSTGYVLTAIGSALVPTAEQLERRAGAFEKEAAELTRAAHRVIRLTTSDMLAERIALPAIAAFRTINPEIQIVLDVERRLLDLSAGDADVALRPAHGHDDPGLIVKRLMDDPWAIYCGNGYNAPPANIMEALGHPFATMSGKPQEMLMQAPVKIDIRYAMNTMIGLADTIARDDCIGALPRLAGDRDARLCRCCDVPFDAGGIWLVYPERLKGEPHIRAFVDHLAAYVAEWQSTAR